MTKKQKLAYFLYLVIGVGLTMAFGVWWFSLSHVAHNFSGLFHIFDYLLFIVLSYIVWHEIVMEAFTWYVAAFIKHPEPPSQPEENLRVAYLTAFVPGAEPYSILEKTLRAMVEVDYPHDTWLLDEGDDPEAKRICQKYGVKHYSRKDKEEFNADSGKFVKKTKGGNYNSWLHHYDQYYDILAQHDVDFIPRKDFLMRTLGYFLDPEVAFVGTPQVYGNLEESWIARGAAEQTYGFYGTLQKGFYGSNMTLLIGANHLVRIKAYKDIDGYAAHISEDMLTGMKLYAHENGWKSVYVPEALLIGEGPTTWAAYFGQQMRWSYGCMDIAFRHASALFKKMKGFRRRFNYRILQQFYFSGIAQVAGIVLLTLYFIFGISPARINLLPLLGIYVPLILYQILFQLWLQRFNVDPKTERGLLLYGKVLTLAAWPIFFLAFVGVVRGKRLTYVVTPKGDQLTSGYSPSLFLVHFLLGSITFTDLIIGYVSHNTSGPMIFWATINTVFMYYFAFSEVMPQLITRMSKILFFYDKYSDLLPKNPSPSSRR